MATREDMILAIDRAEPLIALQALIASIDQRPNRRQVNSWGSLRRRSDKPEQETIERPHRAAKCGGTAGTPARPHGTGASREGTQL